jgi:hypothetical protein
LTEQRIISRKAKGEHMSIRNRIAAAAIGVGALGLVGPVAIANAQTTPVYSPPAPIVAPGPVVTQRTLPAGLQLGIDAAQSGWQQGLQALEGGWAAGAQAAQGGFAAGAAAAQQGFAAGAAALGLPAPVVPGIL